MKKKLNVWSIKRKKLKLSSGRKRNVNIWSVLLLFLPVLTAVGVSMSFMTDSTQKQNDVIVGTNTVRIKEDFPEQNPEPGPDGEKTYKKVVTVGNVTDSFSGIQVPCFVRAMLTFNRSDLSDRVTLHGMDLVNWEYHASDGYYYYRHVLKEGDYTAPLMTGFTIGPGEEADQDKLEINIYVESIESIPGMNYLETWQSFLEYAI